MIFIIALIVAVIPVYFWYLILVRKSRKSMRFFFFLVFFLSALFALLFSYSGDSTFSVLGLYTFGFLTENLGLNILITYIILGVLIEYGKNFIVRMVGKNYFKGIDDVVDLSFATALGYTFMENFMLFYVLFSQDIGFAEPVEITKEILSREFFILPIHLFCSGIFGFFYGASLFATDDNGEIRTEKIFKRLLILKGTLISTITYGLFFMMKEIDPDIQTITSLFGIENFPVNERLLPIISFGFFSAGSLYLFHLMEQKKFLVKNKKQKLVEKDEV